MFVELSTGGLRNELSDKLPFAAGAGLALALVLGAIPAFAQSKDAIRRVVISPVLLQYKYAPADFTDAYMLEQARRQISTDAYVHSIGKPSRPGHVFVFSADEVRGREPTFAAEELLLDYKQRWAALANSIPDRLQFSADDISLDYMTYAQGALRSRHQPDIVYEIGRLSEAAKLRLPPLGRREVLGHLPRLSGALTIELPSSVAQAPPVSGSFRLSVDRILRVPALTMERSAAERLWRRPECSPFAPKPLPRGGEASRAAKEAAAKCSEELTAFKPRITIVFDVQTEGLTADGANRIVKAKLMGARVFGSRMELLKTLSPSDFPEAVDSWQGNADRKAAEERRTAALQSAQEAKRLSSEKSKDVARAAARAALRNADTVGIRLGMTLAEAEQVIRGRLKGWVASSKPPSRPIVQSDWVKNPRRPYSEFRTFGSADSEEQIALFSHAGVSNRVMGVVRSVKLQAGVTGETIVKQLLEKYGKDPIFIHKPTANTNYSATLAWTVDFGQPCGASGSDPVSCIRQGVCHTTLTNIGSYQLSVVEPAGNAGELLRDVANPRWVAPVLRVWGAESEDRRTWDAGKWCGCGPTVLADVYPNADPPVLNVAIFDLASYADVYVKAIPDPKLSGGKPPDL